MMKAASFCRSSWSAGTMGGSSSVVELVQATMDEVYGPWTGPEWRPRPFEGRSRRYLWSDAFGVCNYLNLHFATGEKETRFLDQADALITDVHETLGRQRHTPERLDGASDAHPLRGGLRIGKESDEGVPDGDGQYFHYLTKWMFALSRMKIARNDRKYVDWAIELAKAAHRHFVKPGPRMVWKVSIDMKRALTQSEGNLDPVDGYVTYRLLMEESGDQTVLEQEVAEMKRMVDRKFPRFTSSDALDLGEALWLCSWYPDEQWAKHIGERALSSLDQLFESGYHFRGSARGRLMFREMGTTLGLQAWTGPEEHRHWAPRLEELHEFWRDKIYMRDRDISPLMYAASVLPGVWLRRSLE